MKYLLSAIFLLVPCLTQAVDKPNIVVVFTDDQGYGDLSCYGHPTIHTPHIDKMATEGMKLTQFYVASSVCTPSRAALQTGCYPKRVSLHKNVIHPKHTHGLHPDEVTLADMLRSNGYATGLFGKWHLGHSEGMLPLDQGYDTWFGIPYSNDMSTKEQSLLQKRNVKYPTKLPVYQDRTIIEHEPDQQNLTKRITEKAIAFILSNRDRPFFALITHPQPHIPLYASPDFQQSSKRGSYGDAIQEIDWSMGEIFSALEKSGQLDNTLVIYTSDNGPWKIKEIQGGSSGHLRGGKGETWEGGLRVPCIAWWPTHIPAASQSDALTSSIDILPTLAAITATPLQADREIDGKNISPILFSALPVATPHPYFLYYGRSGKLAAIRRGPWKLHLQSGELFQIEHDIAEEFNLAEQHPKRISQLRALAKAADQQLIQQARPVFKSTK